MTYTLSHSLDFYKFTMSQLAFEQHPHASVTFTLKNRGANRLAERVGVDRLATVFEEIRTTGFTSDEVNYISGIKTSFGTPMFSRMYARFLRNLVLPKVTISGDGEIEIHTTGSWPAVTFWETVVMAELNNLYFADFASDDVWKEGDQRLTQKINWLNANPDIKFSDFGTRRRFSPSWHRHVLTRLMTECPGNLVGTSNVGFAKEFGLKPIGTYAHEMPMVYSAIADSYGMNPLHGHEIMKNAWRNRFAPDLMIALTDTYGSDFFFKTFTLAQANKWEGLRHDSGDPFVFGENVIQFYQGKGIDPLTKTLVFSDGLNPATIQTLQDAFYGRINLMYGWGTDLTNDVGLRANNFVMKATSVNKTYTVKLSDNEGKHTGPKYMIDRYKTAIEEF